MQRTNPTNESGVTLLLAILVLSAITAISFSLATIAFIEIRSSSDLQRTEPAVYAVQAMTEDALFNYKRAPYGASYASYPYTTNINGVSLTGPTTLPSENNPYVTVVPVGPSGQPQVQIDLVNALNNNTIDAGYRCVNVTSLLEPGITVERLVYRIVEINNGPNENTVYGPTTLNNGASSSLILGAYQYRIELSNNQNLSVQNLAASITTYSDGTCSSLLGLPHVGEDAFKIQATFSGLTRSYEVKIPRE